MAKRKANELRAESPPISILNARTHNLKNVTVDIPSGKITVVTGVSGSGKSSLAFDTLFAEGQRRYVESLSTYARQFIARMPRPDVDQISNVPPAIALEQKNSVKNARSTIGTGTEVNDYLRVLFARAGTITCPQTGEAVRRDNPQSVGDHLLSQWPGERIYLIAPITVSTKKMIKGTLAELLRQGFTRLMIDGEMVEIDDPGFKAPTEKLLPVVIDRLALREEDRSRLVESIESAFRVGGGRCTAQTRDGDRKTFNQELQCASCPGDCGHRFRDPSPQLLNFSSPLGACPTCQGFGRVTGLDWGKIIPDPSLTLNQNAVACWSGETGQESLHDLRRAAKGLEIRMDVPWSELTAREQNLVREGEGDWYGIEGFFNWLNTKRYKVQARVMIARYRGYDHCPDCNGTRLVPEALAVKLGGRSIGELCAMPVNRLIQWFDELKLDTEEGKIAERPLNEVKSRLRYLAEVGLGYLTLSRQTRTLSGGESQRINLSTSLGSALTDTLYVLDEPTVGLHPRDTHRLIEVLQRLRDLGNTVVIVEHDPDVMRASDQLIDIGPDAGEFGGKMIWTGPFSDLKSAPKESKTAEYLLHDKTGKKKPQKKGRGTRFGRRTPTNWIKVVGASENNLKHVTAKLPLGVLCCITGVSGSGKSSLIHQCLYENFLREIKGESSAEPGQILRLEGMERIDDIVMVDQSGIGRSSRSNPATYLKAYDAIRALLSGTEQADSMGLQPRDFSFNVPGGRCEACEGTGYQTIDMHFLADVSVLCDVCEGSRFQDRVLEVTFNGKNVGDILSLTIDEAIVFFEDYPRVIRGLEPMDRVGLGYLRLGQSTATLSGGEAQRLKLAAHLAQAKGNENVLLLFDEPTTGLHPADVERLLRVFEEALEKGFSLIIIEHNLQLIRAADYVIDMGPDGGEDGGQIVCEGTPEEIAAHPDSITGKYLRKELEALRTEVRHEKSRCH